MPFFLSFRRLALGLYVGFCAPYIQALPGYRRALPLILLDISIKKKIEAGSGVAVRAIRSPSAWAGQGLTSLAATHTR